VVAQTLGPRNIFLFFSFSGINNVTKRRIVILMVRTVSQIEWVYLDLYLDFDSLVLVLVLLEMKGMAVILIALENLY
jgi:hypothetical protein